jgi:3-dehydroquinate synthase
MHYTIKFPAGQTEYFLNANYSQLLQVAPVNNAIIITDENIHKHYGHLFTQYRVLIIDAGESSKSWETIQQLAEKLIHFDVHKTSVLVGVGGGVVCDITGFLAYICVALLSRLCLQPFWLWWMHLSEGRMVSM